MELRRLTRAAAVTAGVCACSPAVAQPRTPGTGADEYLHAATFYGALHNVRGRLLALGDVNNDGVSDFVTGVSECFLGCGGVNAGQVSVFSGATRQRIRDLRGVTIAPGSPLTVADAFGMLVHAADLDGDGFTEVLVSAETRGVALPGGTTARSGAIDVFSGATGARLYSIHGSQSFEYFGMTFDVLPDVNGDGHPDIIVGSPGKTIGGGGGFFRNGLSIFSGIDGTRIFGPGDETGTTDLRPFVAWHVAHLGDVNGDSAPDFATTYGEKIYIMTGVSPPEVLREIPFGHAVFGGPPAHNPANATIASPTFVEGAGNLNNDGRADLLCIGVTPSNVVRLAAFSGATGLEIFGVDLGVASRRHFAKPIPDANGDGTPDVMFGFGATEAPSDYRVVVLSGVNGATIRTFVDAAWLPNGPEAGAIFDGGAAGHFNGDGSLDFAFWRFNGSYAGEAPSYDIALFTSPPCSGDATGDGVVNFIDLNAVVSDYGDLGACLAGDVNADLVVDFHDLNQVLSAYGSACPG